MDIRSKIVILLLLAFISLNYAQTPQSTVPTLRSIPWELTIIAAIFLSLSFIALGYMLSKAFNIKELGVWANNELYQIIALSFLVFLIFGLLKIENIVFEAYGLSPIGAANPAIENAKSYLISVRSYLNFIIGGLIVEKAALGAGKILSPKVLEIGIVSKVISKVSSIFSWASISISDIIDAFFAPILSVIDVSLNTFSVVYAFNSMQLYFLTFIENVAFTFILPLGLFLRIFSFTRKVANFLIVTAIALYVVFPLTYLLNQNAVDVILNKGVTGSNSWRDILSARIDRPIDDTQTCTFRELFSQSFLDCLSRYAEKSADVGFSLITYIFNFIFVIFTEAAFAFVLFTLLPIINFTITIVIARELGSLLGSDISLNEIIKYL